MRFFLPLALAGALALLGCGHEDAFSGGVLRKNDLAIKMGPLPAGWRRVRLDGADLAFRDEGHGGSVLFDVRCGSRDDDAPLAVLTGQLIMGTTEREVETEEILPFDHREAMHSLLRAKLDGVPMRYDIYVMKKDGCVYDLVYVAPPGPFDVGAAEFERFALGLHADSHSRSSSPSGSRPASGSPSREAEGAAPPSRDP